MDIVERLRTLTVYNWHTVTEIDKEEVVTPLFLFLNQAADEIERLRETLSECHEYISQYSKYEMRQYEMKHENNYVEEPNEAMWLSFKIEKLLGKKE